MPDYIKGLEKGLEWLREMQNYEVETDVLNAVVVTKGLLDMVVSDYLERLEKEKAAMI